METSRNVQVRGKFLNRHSIHNQMDLIVITVDPRQWKRRCGKCNRCLAEECELANHVKISQSLEAKEYRSVAVYIDNV